MVVKVFCGDEFSEHEHEFNQFKEICDLIYREYETSDKYFYIFANFIIEQYQIDVAVLTQKGPAILELKSYKGKIIGSENGNWSVITENGKEVNLPENLFLQLRNQKFPFGRKLKSIRTKSLKIFERIEEEKLEKIQCWGYFEKGSSYEINQINENAHIWFDIITANVLIEKLDFVDAGYLLTPANMDAIVKEMHLIEYPKFKKEPIKKGTIEQVIQKYINERNIIMLDAIYQWATNPTSQSAINKNRIPDHERAIKRNLLERYEEHKNIDEIIESLKQNISDVNLDFKIDYLKVENRVKEIFDKQDILLNETTNRLSKASDLDKIIVWFYAKFKDIFPRDDEYHNDEYSAEKNNKLGAIFNASGYRRPDDMISVLIKLGLLNKLKWISSGSSCGSSNLYVQPSYLEKLLNDIDKDISLPQSVDIKNYIDSLFKTKKYEQLRIIDELIIKDNWVEKRTELTGEILPEKGIIGFYHDYVAISPFIVKELNEYLTKKKREYLSIHSKIEEALVGLSAKYPQKVGITPQSYFGIDYEWEIISDDTLGERQSFLIFLTPWINSTKKIKKPMELLEQINEKTKYLILIVTNHNIPNLAHLLGNNEFLNLIILSIDEKKVYVKKIGTPPMLLDAFLDEFKKFNYEIHNVDKEKKIEHKVETKQTSKEVKTNDDIKEDIKGVPDLLIGNNNIIIGSKELPKQWGVLGISNNKKAIIDLNAPHICFVSGMMGAGKGYTIGVISEMLASRSIPKISEVTKNATIIVLYKPKDDVPSEFWSMRFANDNKQEIQGLKAYETEPMKLIEDVQFRIFLDPGVFSKESMIFAEEYQTKNILPLYIDPATLIAEDWANALATGEGSDALYIKRLFKILRDLHPNVSLEDVSKSINNSDLTKSQKGLANARLEILSEYFKKEDFVNKLAIGGVNIIDFRKCMYQPDDIFTIMTLIMSKLQNKKEFESYPFVFVMNEAHMYFKKGISKEFVDTIENLIRRKRHGANWLLLDTHLPNDVDSKVIELSDVKVLHFTDKTVDSPILKRILEGYKEKLYELNTGECIVFSNESSEGLSIPIKVKVRPRITKHGGATKTAI